MSRESPSDAWLYRVAERPADPPGRLESPEATIDILPDDWNRGARDHPGGHQVVRMVKGLE